MKKIIAGLLSVTMALGCFALPTEVMEKIDSGAVIEVSADNLGTYGDFECYFDDESWDEETESYIQTNVVNIIGYSGSASKVTIPEKINGYTVTSVDWFIFEDHNEINTITIEADIEIPYWQRHTLGYNSNYNEEDGTCEYVKDDNLTIIGYEGTTVERYAIENGFTFKSNGKKSSNPIFEYCVIREEKYDEEGWEIGEILGICLESYLGSDSKLVIPETYKGYKVLSISDEFCNNDPIVEEVVLPDNEIDIGIGAFVGTPWEQNLDLKKSEYGYYYANINDYFTYKKIIPSQNSAEKLPDGTYLVGESFYYANENRYNNSAGFLWKNGNLIKNYNGDPISVLGYGTLYCCAQYSDKNENDYIYHDGYYDEDNDKWYDGYYENKKTGEKLTPSDFWSFDTLTIPNGVKYIAENAFLNHGFGNWNNYNKIKKIELPDSLLAIESGWFLGECLNGLESIDLPKNLKYLGDKAFMGTQIKSDYMNTDISFVSQVVIPESLEHIGEYALGYYAVLENYNKTTIKKIPSFKIYCYENTAGEKYAKDNGFDYEIITPDTHIHSYTGKITKKPTCTADGVKTFTCTACGATKSETIKATGHTFGSWTTTKKATCKATGTQTRKCSVCGKTETKSIAKLSHTYKTTVVAPTYAAQGYTLHKCSVCGTSYKDKYTAKKTVPTVTAKSTYTYTTNAVRINWNKVSGATGYKIYRYNPSTKKWTALKAIYDPNVLTYKDSNLKSGTVYKYKVKAFVKSGGKFYFGSSCSTITTATKPTTATITKTAKSSTAVRLYWKKATCTGYKIQRYNATTKKWVDVKTVSSATTNYRIASLKKNTSYKFRVCAYKNDGKKNLLGAWSYVTVKTTK